MFIKDLGFALGVDKGCRLVTKILNRGLFWGFSVGDVGLSPIVPEAHSFPMHQVHLEGLGAREPQHPLPVQEPERDLKPLIPAAPLHP